MKRPDFLKVARGVAAGGRACPGGQSWGLPLKAASTQTATTNE